MLCTLSKKTSGNATVCGFQIGKSNDEIRKKIGVVFQKNSLDVIFLGKMNVDNILEIVSIERKMATYLVNSWVMAGIIVVNSVTVTLGVMGIMVEDEDKNRITSFWVSPVSRSKITLGYILATFIIGCVFCLITLGISEVYIYLSGGNFLGFNELIKAIIFTVINVFSSSCFVFFIATFIHTNSAFSALSTILGTLVGFIAGMYLPMGVLPNIVQNAVKCFPIVYGTSLMREVYVKDAMKNVFSRASSKIVNEYTNYMGITLLIGEKQVDDLQKVLILLLSSFICIILSVAILRNKNIKDR